MNTVYAVIGESTKDYDTTVSWCVGAYSTKELAMARVKELHEIVCNANELVSDLSLANLTQEMLRLVSTHPRGDVNFQWNWAFDYLNYVYYVEDIPVIE